MQIEAGAGTNLIAILVSNHFGVLMRVTTIFSRRACNIRSLTVAETENPEVSRITILFDSSEKLADQIQKLLEKQEDVLRARLLPAAQVTRELLMVKVRNTPSLEDNMKVLREQYNTKILSTQDGVSVVEFTGSIDQTGKFITLMERYGIVEICRTGAAAMAAGAETL